MRLTTPRALKFTCGLLVAAMFGCFAFAVWFDHRKHEHSGIPGGHFAVNENGRLFFVPRGGPPLDQRQQFPLTAEQYRLWEENDRSSSLWGGRAVLFFFAFVGIAIWLRIAEPGRRSAAELSNGV